MQPKSFHFCPLNLPPADLKFEQRDGRSHIFDPLRGKWLLLTDEEWVRQNFVSYLINQCGYPASVIANEIGLRLNRTLRRADTVIFGADRTPLVIVEYKAPSIEITQGVFDQIVRYNMVLRAKYLIVTNGLTHYCCLVDYSNDSYRFLPEIPAWKTIRSEEVGGAD